MKSYKLSLLVTVSISAILVTGCGGGGGTSVPVTPAPTIALSFASPKVNVGTPVVLTWTSTNATSCTGSDGLSGSLLTGNSTTITPTVGGVAKYTVSCTGAGGSVVKSAELITPIPVQKTSYLNYKTVNLPPQTPPTSSTFIANEAVTSGHAYGDFFQDGTISMIAASNVFDQKPDTLNGKSQRIYFFQKDTKGKWVDKSSVLLTAENRTGCISPRKLAVADFNSDGKPDVFLGCHGIDGEIPAGYTSGEKPRYLLSQPDGTYKNIEFNLNCYCHGAAAADFNGDGYADVILASPVVLGRLVYLKNNKDGTFSDTPSLIPSSTDVKFIWSLEFIDINVDGKYDLFLWGSENFNGWNADPAKTNPLTVGTNFVDWQPTFIVNDGANKFSNTSQLVKIPYSAVGDISDIIVADGKIALRRGSNNVTGRMRVQVLSYPAMAEIKMVDVGTIDAPFFNLYNGDIVGSWDYNSYTIKW